MNKMKRLLFPFIVMAILTGCQSSQKTEVLEESSDISFAHWTDMDKKKYIFEQHALLRNRLIDRGVESKVTDEMIVLTIPGNITFAVNSAKMNWNVQNILNKITPVLKKYPLTSMRVLGHSDSRGDSVLNQRLSEKRARVIYNYFIRSGIDSGRITSRGLGENELLNQEESSATGRAMNRRVVLEIFFDKVEETLPVDTKINESTKKVSSDEEF